MGCSQSDKNFCQQCDIVWHEKAHDLKNIITPLSGSLCLLELTDLTLEQRKYVSNAQNTIHRLLKEFPQNRFDEKVEENKNENDEIQASSFCEILE